MQPRNSYLWWLGPVVFVALAAMPAGAQAPSPLELARGLRDNGQVDLALEYLKELENQPLSADDKAAILLERAKCLLEASDDEPDEATRIGMVAEAREGLKTFLVKYPKHPRAVEAVLTEAKLTALDAKEQLSRARKIDIPPEGNTPEEAAAYNAAVDKQKAEAAKARPLFLLAANKFSEASKQIRARLDDKTLDPNIRKTLERETFEAQLSSGINQFNTAETYFNAVAKEKSERNKYLDLARETFQSLAKGPPNNRTVWIALAWSAEVTFEQDDTRRAAEEVSVILKSTVPESEDGKRLARFFQLRRNYLAAFSGTPKQKTDSETEIRNWLRVYANSRSKLTPEVHAVRFYLARLMQVQAESTMVDNKGKYLLDKNGQIQPPNSTARRLLKEAQDLYGGIATSDNEYTARATRQRMHVVRLLMGEADQPLSTYDTFEKAQMASLIQMNKLSKAENFSDNALGFLDLRTLETQHRQSRTIALLEQARQLATPADNPADVTDVHLRLIYYYRLTGQPYQAAVLGEHLARTTKGTGGKAALAGLFSLNSYLDASKLTKDNADARAADREHAVAVARFLDEKFPNDTATDTARHQLGNLYFEEKKYPEAFEALLKVRPAYNKITDVRLLEGFIATQLTTLKESPLPDAKKAEVFRRAITELAKVSKPAVSASEAEVRGYVFAHCRIASLLLAQGRADPATEKTNPGYNRALTIVDGLLKDIPTFNVSTETQGGTKKPSLDGLEMTMLAQDIQIRATFLRARAMLDAAEALPAAEKPQKYEDIAKSMQPMIDLMQSKGPLFTAEMKAWSEGSGGGDEAVQKSRIAQLAGGIDKVRIDVLLTAFRVRVKQGKGTESNAILDLLVKSGGSIENSLPLLEPVGRELAVQIAAARKAGNKTEAEALSTALGGLLEKIAKVKNLPTPTVLFTGQMLIEVGKHDQAVDMLKKVPAPDFNILYKPELNDNKQPTGKWQEKETKEIPQEVLGRTQSELRSYAAAQHGIARAWHASNKLKEAEDLLKVAIDGNDKTPNWGSGRLYLYKELAAVYESKGAAIATPKEANIEWGKALNEWKTVQAMQKGRISRLKPPAPNAPANEVAAFKQQLAEAHNAYADAFFDVNRCLIKANQQLLKGLPPEKIQKTYETVAKNFREMERQIAEADWQPEVQHRFADFLKEVPELVKPYKDAGGKLFLERMPVK